ncbi:MAG: SBBP repeat-containing protein [Cyanobacteria bacterium SBLK]|nr:SBBP repeat-containing protein [Cyanobacteria bacterium SBLK]
MLPTGTENGVDPSLTINLERQSLALNAELSEPFPLNLPPSGSSSPPPPSEQIARQWLQQLGTTDDDTIDDMAVDRFGNVYLAGSTTGELFLDWGMERDDSDAWLAKFSSSGQLLWGRQILTPSDDYGSSIAVDDAGSVYIAGSTWGILGVGVGSDTLGSPDAWLAKYDTNGNPLWTQQKNFEGWTSVGDLEVDAVGNAYLTGNSYIGRSIGSRNIAWATRYSTNGELNWSQSYSISFYGETKNILSRGVALDNTNHFYVAVEVGRWMHQGRAGSGDPHPYWDNGVWHTGIDRDGTGTLISKYTLSGNLVWQQYLNGPEGSDRIATDDLGYFYLGSDRGLAQYNSNGSLLWQKDFATPQTTTGMIADAQGNIYFSGENADNARAVKYDNLGNLLWEEEFGTSEADLASAIAIDADGTVYLAGITRGALGQANGGETDIWLAQYLQVPNQAPQSLSFSLDRQYKATDTLTLKNGWVQDLDGAIDLARVDLELMDANGTAIAQKNITDFSVAAWSPNWGAFESDWDLSSFNLSEGTYRLRAIAYDAAGAASSAFERQFLIYSNSAPERLQFSLTGNQYAANETLTVKNAWVYDKDGGKDIASIDFQIIDALGNAIDLEDATQFNLASWSHQWANFAYELDLTQLTLNPGIYTLRGTAYDLAGAQGSSFERKFQLNLPTNAALAWVHDTAHRGNDIAIDNEGNLYVTGTAFNWIIDDPNTFTRDDIWIAKYDRNGNLLWQEEWGTSQTDSAEGITVDDGGNVYLTGSTTGDLNGTNAGSDDAWLAKYDTHGHRLWTKQLGSNGNDRSVDVAIDEAGNVYIAGDTDGDFSSTIGERDPLLAKYNTNGDLLWRATWWRSAAETLTGITVDNVGNIYMTGHAEGEVWLAKYNKYGSRLWERDLGVTMTGSAGIAADRLGNLYLTGYTYGSLAGTNQGHSDVWLAKYDSNGDRDWLQQFGTDAIDNSDDITVDNAGNIYLTGGTQGALSGTHAGIADIWVRKYDSIGNLTWQEQWGTSDAERVEGIGVKGNNIYLVGQTGANGVDPDNSWIVKYA